MIEYNIKFLISHIIFNKRMSIKNINIFSIILYKMVTQKYMKHFGYKYVINILTCVAHE